jgi:hypothetical protein
VSTDKPTEQQPEHEAPPTQAGYYADFEQGQPYVPISERGK